MLAVLHLEREELALPSCRGQDPRYQASSNRKMWLSLAVGAKEVTIQVVQRS
jgi:hypothetical protein